MSEKITIIGVGDDGLEGLTRQAQETLRKARTVFGPASLLERLASTTHDSSANQQHEALAADLDAMAVKIHSTLQSAESGPIVLVAGGDPLFYGTARYICEKVGEEHFEVLPHVSSMQLAFARVKESWDEAYLTNVATQSLRRVVEKVRSAEKAGIFTSAEITPASIAKALLEQGIEYFNVYVCENLGSKDERVTQGSINQIANMTFSDLNVMILVRLPDVPDRPASLKGKRVFGNPDEYFLQSQPKRGLLTQSEVRVLALAEMDLGPNSIAWDVGAGSGSVAIEAAQLSPGGHVYAIEMDAEDYNLLIENARTFGTENLTPVLGEAPAAWSDLPDPDAIFIGGTGRGVLSLVELAWRRLKNEGRFVVQIGNIDVLSQVADAFRKQGAEPQVLMVNLARSQQQLDAMRFEAANPSFLVIALKNHE